MSISIEYVDIQELYGMTCRVDIAWDNNLSFLDMFQIYTYTIAVAYKSNDNVKHPDHTLFLNLKVELRKDLINRKQTLDLLLYSH